MKPSPANNTDIAIIGAGPIGLLLANLLGKRGLRVRIVEERQEPLRDSMAIGITPSSLSIMKTLDLDRIFLDRGIPVTTVKVFENGKQLGDVFFSSIPADHPFMLSLPQSETVSLLRANLRSYPSVEMLEGARFIKMQQERSGVQILLEDVKTGESSLHTAGWLVGCDGYRSAVRQGAGIHFPGYSYRSHFCMADFEDDTGWSPAARLYFGRHGAVESFPLSGGRRRWIVQLAPHAHPDETALAGTVAEQVFRRTGIALSHASSLFSSHFQPQRHLATTYACGRVLLCGDAAHVMSPIGGQGMNTGFADAAHLDRLLSTVIDAPGKADDLSTEYSRTRQRAFNMAANRAARGMWLGTRRGMVCSLGRRLLMRHVLLRSPVRDRLATSFAMLTTPGSEVRHAT